MKKILIIDDMSDIRDVLKEYFEEEGYEVSTAENGIEAERVISQNPPDLVITDILMPEKEGLEVILDVKKKMPAVKVIAISGAGKSHVVDYLKIAEKFGADRIFQKPFMPEVLIEAARELLNPDSRK